MTVYPLPTEIATPWTPQDIAWYIDGRKARWAALRAQVDNGQDYLVREVIGVLSSGEEKWRVRTIDEALESIERTGPEFDLLQSPEVGLRVPDIEWHAFMDTENTPRILARVAVIEGFVTPFKKKDCRNELERRQRSLAKKALSNYRAEGGKLADLIPPDQCMYGNYRNKGLRARHDTDGLFVVDIEPRF